MVLTEAHNDTLRAGYALVGIRLGTGGAMLTVSASLSTPMISKMRKTLGGMRP